MKYNSGDHIVYGIKDELFYAVIRNPQSKFPAPGFVTIQTLYSFFAIYDDGTTGLSLSSELPIEYIRGIVPKNLTKKEVFDAYPEYIV